MGIPGHLTCLLRNLYAGQEATVRTMYQTTDCPIQWTWIWVNSRRWWGTRKLGMLQCRGLRKVWYDLASEQQHVKTELMPDTVTVEERAFLFFFFFNFLFYTSKGPWCWERLKAKREEGGRGWDGWMVSATQRTWVWTPGDSEGQGSLACCSPWGHRQSDMT